jgi:hypothetical protein
VFKAAVSKQKKRVRFRVVSGVCLLLAAVALWILFFAAFFALGKKPVPLSADSRKKGDYVSVQLVSLSEPYAKTGGAGGKESECFALTKIGEGEYLVLRLPYSWFTETDNEHYAAFQKLVVGGETESGATPVVVSGVLSSFSGELTVLSADALKKYEDGFVQSGKDFKDTVLSCYLDVSASPGGTDFFVLTLAGALSALGLAVIFVPSAIKKIRELIFDVKSKKSGGNS